MPSEYQRAIQRHRKALRELEAAARSDLERAYFQAKQQLTADLKRTLALPGEAGPARTFQIARLEALADQTERELARLNQLSEQVITQGQRAAAQTAARSAVGMIEAAAPELSAGFQTLPYAAIEELTGVLANGSPMRAVLDRNGAQAGQNARDLLSRALAVGKNPREVGRDLARILDRSLWRAELLARDAILDAGRNAALLSYEESGVCQGWIWQCTYSARTCPCCLAMGGRRFSNKHRFFPRHPGCRCCPSPWLSDEFGPTPELESGDDWLRRQPESVRRKVLPVSLVDEYDRGDVILADFVHLTQSREWGSSYREASIPRIRENARERGGSRTVLPPIPRNVQPIRRDEDELRRVAR